MPLEVTHLKQFVRSSNPDMIVISNAGSVPQLEFIEFCAGSGLPFVSIAQASSEYWWIPDNFARRFGKALSAAAKCYFVSHANLQLTEKQIGTRLQNAEIIRNPFNVPYTATPAWPTATELRLACVGRLHPPSKGQDILLDALSEPRWARRAWHLTFYGEGPCKQVLQLQADKLGLRDRTTFAGNVEDVEGIWRTNHALALPSRYEGMPLALVEAMICQRPAIVTNVAGHREILKDGETGFLADSPTVPALRRALERAWRRRDELPAIGGAAGKRIRELVPPDPAAEFAERLMSLLFRH